MIALSVALGDASPLCANSTPDSQGDADAKCNPLSWLCMLFSICPCSSMPGLAVLWQDPRESGAVP